MTHPGLSRQIRRPPLEEQYECPQYHAAVNNKYTILKEEEGGEKGDVKDRLRSSNTALLDDTQERADRKHVGAGGTSRNTKRKKSDP